MNLALTQRLRRAPGWLRWLLAGACVIAAMNLLVLALNHYSNVPAGVPSSSYSTIDEGVAAYDELLQDAGHEVSPLTDDSVLNDLDPRSTMIVLDAGYLPRAQSQDLGRFVRGGGRLIIGTSGPEPWIAALFAGSPTWDADGVTTARALVPSAETAGVQRIVTAGTGSWGSAGKALPLVGDRKHTLVAVAATGAGVVVYVADDSFLQNRLLARGDNATLALGIAGPAARPVTFLETVHGYGRAFGYGAIPIQWKIALVGLVFAALLLLIARGRRVGPPDVQDDVGAVPARRHYVDSLGLTLAKAKDLEPAWEPLDRELRSRAALATRLREDAPREELAAAAGSVGWDDDVVEVLRHGIHEERDGITAGKAIARMSAGER